MSETATSPMASEATPSESAPLQDVALQGLNLPQFKCHKIVRAARIANIVTDEDGRHLLRLNYQDATRPLGMEDVDICVQVSAAWVQKHCPVAGGVLVVYADGYASFSPASAFGGGYEPLGGNVTGIQEEKEPGTISTDGVEQIEDKELVETINGRVCRQCLGSGTVNVAGNGCFVTKACPACSPE